MPLLKSDIQRAAMKEAVVLDLGDLGRQAARLRLQAEGRAESIVAAAEVEARRIKEAAASKGFDQGLAAGHAEGLARGREEGKAEALSAVSEKVALIQTAWSEAAREWDEHRKLLDRESRQAVLTFAIKMAECLVHRRIATDPTVVLDQVREALSHVLQPYDVSVSVHPDDRPLLEEAMPRLVAEFVQVQHITLVENQQVAPGGCVVSYGQGRIDATIDTQINRIVEMLLPAAPNAQSNEAEA